MGMCTFWITTQKNERERSKQKLGKWRKLCICYTLLTILRFEANSYLLLSQRSDFAATWCYNVLGSGAEIV